jgi:universal stress protein A
MKKQLKKIICAVDFSDPSDALVEYAASMHGTAAELILLHIEPIEAESEELLKKLLHEFSRYSELLSQHHARALFTVRHGDPAAGILDYAREEMADMILIGSHGNTAIGRLLVGSTAETLMRKAHCPVIILKTPEQSLQKAEGEIAMDTHSRQ